jgi:NAD(P) transhydrogenase subunit alpha
MIIAVPKEVDPGENRVALVPSAVSKLLKKRFKVWVESGAGEKSFFYDYQYVEMGAQIISDVKKIWGESDIILKIRPPRQKEIETLRSGSTIIGFIDPFVNLKLVKLLASRNINTFSMDMIPRISRAQNMDALTSQANLAGYKSVIIAADSIGKLFPMMITAAGTTVPIKVLVIGAGVAGLQAIATAKRLGAVVEAFDVRPEVKEEVESVGAKFLEITIVKENSDEEGYIKEVSEETKIREQEILAQYIEMYDVIITTASVYGKKAPVLITKDMVKKMKPGSVIVDLAAERGGNCELTIAGKEVVYNGVKIIGAINLPSSMQVHASEMYSNNISSFLQYIVRDGKLRIDFADEIINRSCIVYNGVIRNEEVLRKLGEVQ